MLPPLPTGPEMLAPFANVLAEFFPEADAFAFTLALVVPLPEGKLGIESVPPETCSRSLSFNSCIMMPFYRLGSVRSLPIVIGSVGTGAIR